VDFVGDNANFKRLHVTAMTSDDARVERRGKCPSYQRAEDDGITSEAIDIQRAIYIQRRMPLRLSGRL